MSTSNKLKPVDMIELGSDFIAKQPPGPTRRNCPRANIFGIAPYQIAEGPFMRDLLSTSNDADLVKGADLWTQTTMDAEDLAVDDCTEDEEVEHLAAGLPDRCIPILLLAFFIESVDLSDLTRFVVAANKGNAIRVSKAEDQLNPAHLAGITDLAFRQSSNVKVSKLK